MVGTALLILLMGEVLPLPGFQDFLNSRLRLLNTDPMNNPPSPDLHHILKIATQAALYVGEKIRHTLRSPQSFRVMHKGVTDLVTEIDLWSEEEIIKTIREAFPEHHIIGEETASSGQDVYKSLETASRVGVCWIVDPLDGTTNFANRIPHVGVSIGVLVDGVRSVGVVYDPFRDELFAAVVGGGAKLNGDPIETSKKSELVKAVIATGFPHDRIENWSRYKPAYEAFLTSSRDLRRFGAATLDQCWVACGRFDAFFEYTLKPWDVAAGSLIVEEAGGKVGNFSEKQGQPFSIFSESFLFSGPTLFPRLLEIGARADQEGKRIVVP